MRVHCSIVHIVVQTCTSSHLFFLLGRQRRPRSPAGACLAQPEIFHRRGPRWLSNRNAEEDKVIRCVKRRVDFSVLSNVGWDGHKSPSDEEDA